MKTITIEIKPDGEIHLDVTGYKGRGCEKLTQDIERALGVASPKTLKPEFYQEQAQQQKAGQG